MRFVKRQEMQSRYETSTHPPSDSSFEMTSPYAGSIALREAAEKANYPPFSVGQVIARISAASARLSQASRGSNYENLDEEQKDERVVLPSGPPTDKVLDATSSKMHI